MKYIAIGGGGFKAYTYVGALKKFDLQNVKAVSGSSAGSIIGFFVCLTKKYQNIEKIAIEKQNRIFESNDIDIHNFLPLYGLNTGQNIEKKLENLCEEYCGTRRPTFNEFIDKTGVDFYVSTTNLTKRTCEYFCNKTTPDFDVISAIRMSISIPLYFTPVEYNGDTYIDGSFFKPIPYDILLDNYDDISKENGLMIGSKDTEISIQHTNLTEYVSNIFNLIRKGLISKSDNENKFTIISIDTSNYSFIQHKCDDEMIINMIEHGTNAIEIK